MDIKRRRKKCGDLNNQLNNAKLSLKSSLQKMNEKNNEAVKLRKEIEYLESQYADIMRSASLNAVGLGDKKGKPMSISGLLMDGMDTINLSRKVKEKVSELSYVIQDQKHIKEI